MNGISKQHRRRPPCGKKRLSESKAKGVIRSARRSNSEQRRECRAYFCAPCGSWHTTSRPYGDFLTSTPPNK